MQNAAFLESTSLFQKAINLILIFQIEFGSRLFTIDTFSVQHESEGRRLDALLGGVTLKDLGQLGAALDFEKGLFASLVNKGEKKAA